MAGLVEKATAGLAYLIGLQLLSRVLTFLLNVLIVRSVDAAHFGVATVHVQLVLAMTLLLSREGFRRAAARCRLVARRGHPSAPAAAAGEAEETGIAVDAREMVRMLWMVVPLGVLVAGGVAALFLFFQSEEEAALPGYQPLVLCTAASAIVLLVSEPFWIVGQMLLLFKARVAIEGFAVFCRCVVTFVLATYTSAGLMAFAYGQLAQSALVLGGYLWYFSRRFAQQKDNKDGDRLPFDSMADLLPSLGGYPWDVVRLVATFSWQSVEKLLLTEGEKFVLKFTETLVHQGSFSVVSNLGSLVARFLFQPVEEISFSLFSRLLGGARTGVDKAASANMRLCDDILAMLVKFMIIIGLVFCSFGPSYSYLLLEILYGGRYGHSTGAPTLLGFYCLYVFCMALNGVTEAMVNAAASAVELRRYNYLLVAFSVVYICASVAAVQAWGTVGLVQANCANMAVRVAYSSVFIRGFFRRNGLPGYSWAASVPHWALWVFCGVVAGVTRVSNSRWCTGESSLTDKGIHVLVGCALFLVGGRLLLSLEGVFVRKLVATVRSRDAKPHAE
mmetsp:Transcript_1617/g.5711  ORF Transcript_1617/g.5711 Transcript_1617/m.5711 type:complete len:560 (-) Transcript_1617:28-1707(-)